MSTPAPDLDHQLAAIFGQVFGTAPTTGAVAVELVLGADELRSGAVKTIEIEHPGECTVCEPTPCPACEGHGFTLRRQGFLTIQQACRCAGGKVHDRHCPACKGSGAIRDVVDVTVPAGSEAGQIITIAGEGDRIDGGGRGDLLVHLAVAGVEVPRASVHDRSRGGAVFVMTLALVLAAAALVSQLW